MQLARLQLIAAAATLAAALPSQNAVLQWNHAALAAIRTASSNPPVASRHLAMLHTAVFDAANGVHPKFHHYLVAPTAAPNTNRTAAVTTAAHDVLATLYPAQAATFDALRDEILGDLPNNPPKTNGISWGASVAQQILANRVGDGSTTVVAYPGSTAPGMWRPTVSFGGIVRPALLPGWGNVTPFGVASVAALQPPAPPALDTPQYTLDVNFTKDLGGTTSTARTAEQTEIARFWASGAGTSTPPGHWNEIGGVVAEQERLDLVDSARMFALLNIALADAAIVCWRTKYDQGYWRPITAIQLDGDGNDETTADPTWTPLLATPPFPEYTSGHSTFSGAAAAVLAEFFADDEIAFTVGSDDLPGVQRSYASFSDAAWESGISRIYGGIHWLSANVRGLECGADIGLEVTQAKLRKL